MRCRRWRLPHHCPGRTCLSVHSVNLPCLLLQLDRSEEHIRAYFKSGGAEVPPANGCDAANGSTLADLAARFPPPDADTFRKWFPGLALSKTACDKPRCAGCAVPYGSCIRWHMLPCCVRFAPPYLHAADQDVPLHTQMVAILTPLQAAGAVLPKRRQRGGHVHIGGHRRAARALSAAGAAAKTCGGPVAWTTAAGAEAPGGCISHGWCRMRLGLS